ncbi:MAG: Uma2 family endonuclease [Phototrophicaceae bacterium]
MVAAPHHNQDPLYMSEPEYLAFEETSDIKHEYVNGRVFAMAGADWNHVMITQSTSSALYFQLRGKSCSVGTNDLRLKVVSKKVSYRYPDIMVICSDPNFIDNRKTIDNPNVIIEVLSPTTALEDHNTKLTEYTALDSVQEYLLIAQDEVRVEQYTRQTSGKWIYNPVSGLGKVLTLASIDCKLALSDIYEQVDFNEQ